jgi:energy-coupling factor transporter ATP-binding protein EcfA2
MSVLEARRIAVAPSGTPDPVVRGVSLAVGSGEWVALGGPNGSGKSTVALALAGLLPVREGEVRLDGRVLAAGDGAAREPIAAILQDPGIQLLQSRVLDELAFTARNLGHAETEVQAAVSRWASRFGLEPDLLRDPRELSAGRQQLVLLAAALAAGPRFLIADEPGAHLDPSARARVLEVVREAVSDGLGVLWVTQDGTERAAADRHVALGDDRAEIFPVAIPPSVDAAVRVAVTWGAAPEAGPRIMAAPGRLEVPARGITLITGGNGIGKSVLLAALAGLETTGQIQVAWNGPEGPPPILVPEIPEQTIVRERIEDEVVDPARWRGVPREEAEQRARALLERLDLTRLARPGIRSWSLSSGEKRVVSLVSSLIAPAGAYLLDEPTAGLDPARKGALSAILRDIANDTPVVIASQDLSWGNSIAATVVPLR